MTVSESTKQAEGLGSFFKILGRISAKAVEKLATNVLKNPGRALEITSNIATAAATKSPNAALSSLPEVINFYHTGKGSYLGKLVFIFYHLNGTKNRKTIPFCTNWKKYWFRTKIRKKIKWCK